MTLDEWIEIERQDRGGLTPREIGLIERAWKNADRATGFEADLRRAKRLALTANEILAMDISDDLKLTVLRSPSIAGDINDARVRLGINTAQIAALDASRPRRSLEGHDAFEALATQIGAFLIAVTGLLRKLP